MIQVAPGTKVHLACRPVSMRYGFDGLAAQVATVLKADPYSGHGWMCRLVDASALAAAGFERVRKAELWGSVA